MTSKKAANRALELISRRKLSLEDGTNPESYEGELFATKTAYHLMVRHWSFHFKDKWEDKKHNIDK